MVIFMVEVFFKKNSIRVYIRIKTLSLDVGLGAKLNVNSDSGDHAWYDIILCYYVIFFTLCVRSRVTTMCSKKS